MILSQGDTNKLQLCSICPWFRTYGDGMLWQSGETKWFSGQKKQKLEKYVILYWYGFRNNMIRIYYLEHDAGDKLKP